VIKVITANRSGVPDVICCIRGKFVSIEIKAPYGRQTELQKYNERKVTEAGGVYKVIRSFEEFLTVLKEMGI